MTNRDLIIEGLHRNIITESVNTALLDRFVKYCKAANVRQIETFEVGGKYYLVGISDSRFKELVKSFVKSNDNRIVFEYDLTGSTLITKLETKKK